MRMRKKKHGDERISACSEYTCENPTQYKGAWRELFEKRLGESCKGKRLELEIGCGKGSFITETAVRNPDTLYCAVERVRDVIMLAMEKAKAAEVKNVIFLNLNAQYIRDYFDDGEIDRIYLNFSDPWVKARHAKRRLTSENFLNDYRALLSDGGAVFFKTDNRGLFDYSLESFAENGWRLEHITFDLHASEYAEGNIMTEYERNFSSKGQPIHRLEAYR